MRRGLLRNLSLNRSPRPNLPSGVIVEKRGDGIQYIRPTPARASK